MVNRAGKVRVRTDDRGYLSGLDSIFKQRRLKSHRRGLFYRAVPGAAPMYAGKDLQRVTQGEGVTHVHVASSATITQKEWTRQMPRLEPVLDTKPEAVAMGVAAVLLLLAPTVLHLQWGFTAGGAVLLALLAIVSMTGWNLIRKDRTEREMKAIKELIAASNFVELERRFQEIAQRRDDRFRDFLTIGTYGELLGQALSDGRLEDLEVRVIALARDLVNDTERLYIHRFYFGIIMAQATRDEVLDDQEASLIREFQSICDFNEAEIKDLRQLQDYYFTLRREAKEPLQERPAPAPLTGSCYLDIPCRLLKYAPVREYLVGSTKHIESAYSSMVDGRFVVTQEAAVFLAGTGQVIRIPLSSIDHVTLLPADDTFELALQARPEPVHFSAAENNRVVMILDKALAGVQQTSSTASR